MKEDRQMGEGTKETLYTSLDKIKEIFKKSRKKRKVKSIGGFIIGALVVLAVALIILAAPVICYGIGYIGGLFVKATIGGVIVETLNTLFAVDRFTLDLIPPLMGIITMVSSIVNVSNKAKEKINNKANE